MPQFPPAELPPPTTFELMFRKKTELFLILLPVLAGIFAFPSFGSAVTCGGRSAIGNSPPYWGTNATQNVNTSKGSQVRVSIKGEDGCAGQTAQYQIKKNGSVVATISVGLTKGSAVIGQQDVYVLYGDWTVSLDNGDYQAQLLKVGNQILQSNSSSNTLVIGSAQACNLTKAYASPNGGNGGDQVQLIVEGQGTCQDWGVTITVYNALGSGNRIVFNGSSQKFSSSSNKLQWSWTLPSLTAGQGQAPYKFIAHSGNQNLESPPFLVIFSGTGGAVCGNGKCESDETQKSCPADCKPGQDQIYPFEIPNPLKGGVSDFSSLIKIIAQWIFNLAIPIAVAMIVYSGILFLTSAGDTSKITKAREVLTYAVVGLAIILIGSGFVTLIQSILELGGTRTGTPQDQGPGLPVEPQLPTLGAIGNKCSTDRNCLTVLKCKNMICQRPTGNLVGEPCNGGASCDIGLACDDTSEGGIQIIDEQTLGTCFVTSAGGGRIGDVCQKDKDCISGFKCNQICQRSGGNLNGEACLKTSNPSNCKSTACSTLGTTLDGVCVNYPGN